ncbi:unnamed protein product [Amoebophrya sp. A25]|nr:unnamed protein product [Amoebophrya sp. A25]|eukprot:GSA25T00007065001.1
MVGKRTLEEFEKVYPQYVGERRNIPGVVYKFADGSTTTCTKAVSIRVLKQEVLFVINEADSSDSSIPFLIGNDVLAGSLLDLNDKKLRLGGDVIPLFYSKGLYFVNFLTASVFSIAEGDRQAEPVEEDEDEDEEITEMVSWLETVFNTVAPEEVLTFSGMKKLHQRNWHVKPKDLLNRYRTLVDAAAEEDPEFDKKFLEYAEQVTKACKVCSQFLKVVEKPKFGRRPKRVGQFVAMDTFFINFEGRQHAVLHLCDYFSKFSMVFACPGATSTGDDVSSALRRWRLVFGSYPEAIVTDNGNEFCNSKVYSLCASASIKHIRSAPYEHSSNGFIEVMNRIIKEILKRLLDRRASDFNTLSFEDVLLEACSCKNGYVRSSGFSSQFIALGNNVVFDGVTGLAHSPDMKPAEWIRQREALRLEASRLQNLEAELKEVKAILREPARLGNVTQFSLGDRVIVASSVDKNDTGLDRWFPGEVVGVRGSRMVIVQDTAGALHEVHSRRVRMLPPCDIVDDEAEDEDDAEPEAPEEHPVAQLDELPDAEQSDAVPLAQDAPAEAPRDGQGRDAEESQDQPPQQEPGAAAVEGRLEDAPAQAPAPEQASKEVEDKIADIVKRNAQSLLDAARRQKTAIKKSLFKGVDVRQAYCYRGIKEARLPAQVAQLTRQGDRCFSMQFALTTGRRLLKVIRAEDYPDSSVPILPLGRSTAVLVTVVFTNRQEPTVDLNPNQEVREIGSARNRGARSTTVPDDPARYTAVPEDMQNLESLPQLSAKQLRWLSVKCGVALTPQKRDMQSRLRAHYERTADAAGFAAFELDDDEFQEEAAELAFTAGLGFDVAKATCSKSEQRVELGYLRDTCSGLLTKANSEEIFLQPGDAAFDAHFMPLSSRKADLEYVLVSTGSTRVRTWRQLHKEHESDIFILRSSLPALEALQQETCSVSDIVIYFFYHKDISKSLQKAPVEKNTAGATAAKAFKLPFGVMAKGTVELPYEWFKENDLLDELYAAFKKEFDSLRSNEVFDVITRPDGVKLITSKVIFAVKFTPEGAIKRIKVRYVPRGFSDVRDSFLRKDQDVVSNEGLVFLLTLAALNQWELKTTDFMTAFLQSEPYRDDEKNPLVALPYLPDPKLYDLLNVERGKVLKMRKAVYGLYDGPRRWFTTFSTFLKQVGFRQINADCGLWVLPSPEDPRSKTTSEEKSHLEQAEDALDRDPLPKPPKTKISGVLCLHVDDSLHGGDEYFQQVWAQVEKRFKIGETEDLTSDGVCFCGRILRREFDRLTRRLYYTIDQEFYTQKITQIDIPQGVALSTPMGDSLTLYRSLIGRLNWITFRTHPEIAYDVHACSKKCTSATWQDAVTLNKVARRAIYNRSMRIMVNPDPGGRWQIVCFSDASYPRPSSKHVLPSPPCVGVVIFLANMGPDSDTFSVDQLHCVQPVNPVKSRHVCAIPLYWRSRDVTRKIETVLDAELIATQFGYNLSKYLQGFAIELGLSQPSDPVLVYNDNNSNISHIRSSNRHSNPRLNSLWSCLRTYYQDGKMVLRHICGKTLNFSDVLTKPSSPLISVLTKVIFRGKIYIPSAREKF